MAVEVEGRSDEVGKHVYNYVWRIKQKYIFGYKM